MLLSSWVARARGDIDGSIAAVVFSAPEHDVAAMDVAHGPCAEVGGRKRPLESPFHQDLGVTPHHTSTLLSVLTGEPADGALIVVGRRRRGVLHVFTERFMGALLDVDAELRRLADEDEAADTRKRKALPRFGARLDEYAAAWQAACGWPPNARPMTNEMLWAFKARAARENGRPLYCWHGPAVPLY